MDRDHKQSSSGDQESLQAFARGMKLADFLSSIQSGTFDDDLTEIRNAISARRRSIAKEKAHDFYSSVCVEDKVRVSFQAYPVVSRGVTGVVTDKRDDIEHVAVKFDRPVGQSIHSLWLPAAVLELDDEQV